MVSIVSRHGLSIDAHHENQPNKHKLAPYKPSIHFNSRLKQLYISKGGCGMMRIEEFKRRAGTGYI